MSIPIRRLAAGMLTAAIIAVVMATATTPAQACCDRAKFINRTTCTFSVHVIINHMFAVDWTINPGVNIFPFTQCWDANPQVTDLCGTVRDFPTVQPDCVDITITAACCLRICVEGPCEWDITNGTCQSCN